MAAVDARRQPVPRVSVGPSSSSYRGRVRLISCAFGACFLLIGGRAAQLQIGQHEHLQRLAEEQYLNTVTVPARRGQIIDRNGSPLAISVDVPSIFANPKAVVSAADAAVPLAKALGMEPRVVRDKLAHDRYFAWIKRQVTPAMAAQVTALHLPGVHITKEPRRFYPNREVAAHVVGFAGLDARGLEGVEKQLDSELLGEVQAVPAVRDARGQAVLAGGLDPYLRAWGQDVRLTLDLQLQHSAQDALERVVKKTGAKSATAVVLDVLSADVLALAAAPAYNPNEGARETAERRRNRVVADMFEPGSTLKPWVVAAALNEGLISSKTLFFCENGRFHVGRHSISDTSPHGWMGLTDILAKSSNIGMAKIGQVFGKDRLEAALRLGGLAQRSGIELPGEAPGMLRPARLWSELDTATIAFGQGVAVNGVQLAALYRALAAGGRFATPRLVRSLEKPDGTVTQRPAAEERRVLRPDVARQVTAMLEAAVRPQESTGAMAAVPGYRVAGKTGTAQKADPVSGGYSRDAYVALFAGYLPADAPRAVIVVAVDEPKTSHYGGTVAAPVFAEIGAAAMQRLGVVANQPIAPELLASSEVRLDRAASNVVDALPAVDAPKGVAPGTVPSFLGMTSRQAMDQVTHLGKGWELVLHGTGLVVAQQPLPGSSRPASQRMQLTLGAGSPPMARLQASP